MDSIDGMSGTIERTSGDHDANMIQQPFVDEDHSLHSLFPPRVWAIRIPVILILLASTVVGSFLGVVMIRSNQKKALKARAAAGKKKA